MMSPQPSQPSQQPVPGEDLLLTPREVAALFGVRTTTIARWARDGRLSPLRTPGGHRRFRMADIRAVLAENTLQTESEEQRRRAEDAVRLYEAGWSIRQVAQQFGCSYGAMRRLLERRIRLRTRAEAHPRAAFGKSGPGQTTGLCGSEGRDLP